MATWLACLRALSLSKIGRRVRKGLSHRSNAGMIQVAWSLIRLQLMSRLCLQIRARLENSRSRYKSRWTKRRIGVPFRSVSMVKSFWRCKRLTVETKSWWSTCTARWLRSVHSGRLEVRWTCKALLAVTRQARCKGWQHRRAMQWWLNLSRGHTRQNGLCRWSWNISSTRTCLLKSSNQGKLK